MTSCGFSWWRTNTRSRTPCSGDCAPKGSTSTSRTMASTVSGEREMSLTQREFALLEALLRQDGAVVSKPQLLDDVWGRDFVGDPNIVEVYAGYLRRKIDDPFSVRTLVTVRGAGYRLVSDA